MYGTADGGRLFYVKLQEEAEELGIKPLDADQAVLYKVDDGLLTGMIGIHADDLLFTWSEKIHKEI